MEADIYQLLYADNTGEVVGLDEVQLLDPTPVERVPQLHELLAGRDKFLQFQSLLILAAWGDQAGVDYALHFLTQPTNEFEGLDTHRLHGTCLLYTSPSPRDS